MTRQRSITRARWARARTAVSAIGAMLVAGIGCAPKAPPVALAPPTVFDRLEQPEEGAAGFEARPGEIDPAELIPLDLLQGPHHVVRSARLDDRMLYVFVVDSDLGPLEVTGRGLLRKRVYEIEALATYDERDLNSGEVYAIELANAASEPVEGVLQIGRHPVRTVTNIPRGLVHVFKATGEMFKGGRTHLEDDYTDEMIGLSGQKRLWAARLGVDPHSTNPHVQARLKRNGWMSLLGQLSVQVATIPVPAGAATIAMSGVGATTSMNEQLDDESPEDVRVRTRGFLMDELGTDEALAERFLSHPWYPPNHQATIIRSLGEMHGVQGRHEFIEMASQADEAHEAYAFTRLALMFGEIHARRARLSRIEPTGDWLVGRGVDDRPIVPLYLDHLVWTNRVAEAEAELNLALDADEAPDPLLIVSGDLTPRAADELADRGWLTTQGIEHLWLAGIDLERHMPEGPDEGRILPEFGGWSSLESWRIAAHRAQQEKQPRPVADEIGEVEQVAVRTSEAPAESGVR